MAFRILKERILGSERLPKWQSDEGKSWKLLLACMQSLCIPNGLLTSFVGRALLSSPIEVHGRPDAEAQLRSAYDRLSGTTATDESCSRTRVNPRIISDAILGLSDGLTVPFALSAGLSALGNTKVVVLGGLAELAAGAISMGLGGYVGARSEL